MKNVAFFKQRTSKGNMNIKLKIVIFPCLELLSCRLKKSFSPKFASFVEKLHIKKVNIGNDKKCNLRVFYFSTKIDYFPM